MMENTTILDEQVPATLLPPPEILKKPKNNRPLPYGNGRGLDLKPRDITWLKYLAWGPARLQETEKIYINEKTKKPINRRNRHRRLEELTRIGYLKKHTYPSLKKSILYFLEDLGIDALTGFGYEPDYIRNGIVPEKHIWHELALTNVARKLYQDSIDTKMYKVLSLYDDRMLKMQNEYKGGKIYPDLKVRIQPFDGPSRDFLFEIEGLKLRRSLYIKKLKGLALKTKDLFVVVRDRERKEALYRYTEICKIRPDRIYFCLWYEFFDGGLFGTKWLSYPEKKEAVIRFR